MHRRWMQLTEVTAAASVVGVVFCVPAFAQSDTARSTGPAAAVLAGSRTAVGAVRTYVPADRVGSERAFVRIFDNVRCAAVLNPGRYRAIVEAMVQRSPTFRRQCHRLADSRLSMVALQTDMLLGPRAQTTVFVAPEGALVAMVRLRALDNHVELIAHEIEHIIEQLDGVDLGARALVPASGVHALEAKPRSFETLRATRIGLKVAEEFRRSGG
jgi:hypothetical protein